MLSRAGQEGARDPRGTPRALGPLAAFAHSWRLLRQRPLATFGLGAAIVSSGLAVCCGLGIFAAPWFMCELFALHIASARGEAPRRSATWLAAGLVQLAKLLVLGLLGLFVLLTLGPDLLLDVAPAQRALALSWFEGLPWLLVAVALATALGVQFEFAPALLIEGGAGVCAALLTSSRMVAQSGLLRSWFTSSVAHALPLLAIAAAWALQSAFGSPVQGRLLVLLLLPWVALSCALGQGMIVASYLALPRASAGASPPTLPSARAAIPAFVLLALILCAPLPVVVALLRPSELTPGTLPTGASPLLDAAVEESARELYLPASALHLVVARSGVQVVVSDGGGAGSLRLPQGAVEHVRVAAAARSPAHLPGETGFAIEVQLADGRRYLTAIDENGVRRDDSLEQRLLWALPVKPRIALALCWVWLAIWLMRAFPRQAELYFAGDDVKFARVARRAQRWLLLPALLAPAIGAWALLH